MSYNMLLALAAAGALLVPSRSAAAQPRAKAARAPTVYAKVSSDVRRAPYQGAISADAETGRIIFSDRADAKAYPASVTKLMTMLLVLEDVAAGTYRLSDTVTASLRACQEKPSVIGLKPGYTISVDQLLYAIMVQSANDAAVALAEFSTARNAGREIRPGDLQAFVVRMNSRAAALGMKDTHYETPNGYPPRPGSNKPFDSSTAMDQLKLARALVKLPQVYRYTTEKVFQVVGMKDEKGNSVETRKFVNHNHILVRDKQKILNEKGVSEVDGLKTGYIEKGGSSIVLTGSRKGHRAIVVVLGSETAKLRDASARDLMVKALDAVSQK